MTRDTNSDEALLEWEASLETGMAQIDEQHRTLIAQIKVIADRSRANRVAETLDFMQNYVREHFAAEERLHHETDYPEAEAHLDVHNAYFQTILNFKKEYDAAGGEKHLLMLLKLTNLLSVWWKVHITGMDRRFADYYRAVFPCRAE